MSTRQFRITVFTALVGLVGLFWALAACSNKENVENVPPEQLNTETIACNNDGQCEEYCGGLALSSDRFVTSSSCSGSNGSTGLCECSFSTTPTSTTTPPATISCTTNEQCVEYCGTQCANPTEPTCFLNEFTNQMGCYCGCH